MISEVGPSGATPTTGITVQAGALNCIASLPEIPRTTKWARHLLTVILNVVMNVLVLGHPT